MKTLVKNVVYAGMNICCRPGKNQAIALMYHSVSGGDRFFNIKPEMFERQMKHLSENNYNVVSLDKLLGYLGAKEIPPRTVIITFDDGYRDNLLTAWPILKKYNIPAAIFICTSLVGAGSESGAEYKKLNYAEIKEMITGGLVEFGSHCQRHVKLARLLLEEAEGELRASKKVLEKELGREIKYLAYPFGSCNEAVSGLAGKYYRLAFGVKPGIISPDSDPAELKRNSIDNQVTFWQFKGIINYGRL